MNEYKSLNPLVPVVRFMARYLPKNDIAQGLIIPLIFTVPIFIYVSLEHPEDTKMALAICGGAYALLVVWGFIGTSYGKRRHETALRGRRLVQLQSLGFEIENIGEYFGYKGQFHNYFFRIYYDWQTTLSRNVDFREITILLYYTPFKDEDNELDKARLNELNKKYKNRLWDFSTIKIGFEAGYVVLHAPFNIFTSFETIESRIGDVLRIAKSEKLQPISEKEVDKLIEENAWWYGPPIETFWKAKNIIK